MIRKAIVALAFTAAFCEEITTEDNITTLSESEDIQNVTEATPLKLNRQKRISQGRDAPIGRYPFMAALLAGNGDFMCGGSVLTPVLILTAYHCIHPTAPAYVRVGSSDLQKGGELHYVNRFFSYPNKDDFWVHDIGVLVLRSRIRNPHTVRLGVPNSYPLAGSVLKAAGWGYTSRGWPRYLQETSLATVDKKYCYTHDYAGHPGSWFCTHTVHSSICKGDSGGPVMYNGYQVGLVSHLNKGPLDPQDKCYSTSPDTMTFVPGYLNWLNHFIQSYR